MFGNTAPGTAIVTGISWLSWPRLIFITLSLIKTAPDQLLASGSLLSVPDDSLILLCKLVSTALPNHNVDIIEKRQPNIA